MGRLPRDEGNPQSWRVVLAVREEDAAVPVAAAMAVDAHRIERALPVARRCMHSIGSMKWVLR